MVIYISTFAYSDYIYMMPRNYGLTFNTTTAKAARDKHSTNSAMINEKTSKK